MLRGKAANTNFKAFGSVTPSGIKATVFKRARYHCGNLLFREVWAVCFYETNVEWSAFIRDQMINLNQLLSGLGSN